MTFSIRFIRSAISDSVSEVEKAILTIGDYQEELDIPMGFWTPEKYMSQWKCALRTVSTGSAELSCLVTAMYDPRTANFVTRWPLYRSDNMIVFQNQILMLNDLEEPFDPEQPCKFIKPHTAVNEDGDDISEWTVPITDIQTFLSGLGAS